MLNKTLALKRVIYKYIYISEARGGILRRMLYNQLICTLLEEIYKL